MVDSSGINYSAEKTPPGPLCLLIVEDDLADTELIVLTLEGAGVEFEYHTAETAIEVERLLAENRYDAVLSDYCLPDVNGLEAFTMLLASGQEIPFILVSGTLGEEAAVECIKSGVTDYVLKDRLVRLPMVLQRSLDEFQLRRQKQAAMVQLRASAWREAIINRIVKAMQGTFVLEDILQTTVNELHEALGVSRCLIFRCDAHRKMKAFHVSSSTAEGERLLGVQCSFYEIYYPQLSRGKQVVFGRIDENSDAEIQAAAHQCQVSSLIITPLLEGENYIGGISVHQCDRHRKWSAEELELVKAIADRCAIAIHQAQLYDRAQTELAERKRAETALQQVMNSLEQRVQQRTVQLQERNEQLRVEIGERERIEAALRESEERFRNLVETTSDLVWEVDANGIYTYLSPQIEELLGYEPEEMLGKTPFDLMPAAERSRLEKLFASLVTAPQPITCLENQNLHKNGSLVILETSAVPFFDIRGNFCGYRGIDRDITERKQAETEIRKALEKERELSQLRSSFISLVSHEFRTPLTTILSSTELLEYYGNSWSSQRKQIHIERIKNAVGRMADLLEDVLTIGRAEVGKLEFKPKPIDLVAWCREFVEEIQLSVGEGKHRIQLSACGDYTGVCMDEKLMGHILNNLLTNAIKYSPEGDAVQFRLNAKSIADVWENPPEKHHSWLSQTGAEKVVIFQIQDKGIGIPPAYRERMFESFHRAENVGNIPGTGLGLAIVKRCVDLHGGQIEVESEVGVGTRFTVILPFNSSAHSTN
ncbi:ATP-binding protein [Phormidium sp. CCY1219]|uniref:ATP-binding protein n=1 Tax=Phormidium sp. CCY1219 TaxID=2886104 RepID=UPI002D1EF56C|nr:ATP-binding protein [Phormidium sp. CCY1219]MEB3828979.1 PAS domain S-box protein [Phormidium sp. CCY1219]